MRRIIEEQNPIGQRAWWRRVSSLFARGLLGDIGRRGARGKPRKARSDSQVGERGFEAASLRRLGLRRDTPGIGPGWSAAHEAMPKLVPLSPQSR